MGWLRRSEPTQRRRWSVLRHFPTAKMSWNCRLHVDFPIFRSDLPERTYVNTAFLTMAIANGLTMAIANPSQELLMNAAFASDMLLNKEESDIRYIERMNFLSEKYAGMERVMVPSRESLRAASGSGSTDTASKESEKRSLYRRFKRKQRTYPGRSKTDARAGGKAG